MVFAPSVAEPERLAVSNHGL